MNFARSPFWNIVPIVARHVVVVERERHLLPVLAVGHRLERLPADEVVVELDVAAVAEIPRREVVVLDVAETKLPPIDAEPSYPVAGSHSRYAFS